MVLRINALYLDLRRRLSGIDVIRINIVVSGMMHIFDIRYIVCMCTAYYNIIFRINGI